MSRCPVTQKEKFPSQLEGQLAMSNILQKQAKHRKQKFRETPSRVYLCQFCSGHHMTSK